MLPTLLFHYYERSKKDLKIIKLGDCCKGLLLNSSLFLVACSIFCQLAIKRLFKTLPKFNPNHQTRIGHSRKAGYPFFLKKRENELAEVLIPNFV
jgi:hypothetical protein